MVGLTEVYGRAGDGAWSSGSGYAVADRLVLTARQLVMDDDGRSHRELKVRPWGGDLVSARVSWWHPDLDVALVQVAAEAEAGPVTGGVRWGRLAGTAASVPCEWAGFPDSVAGPGGVRDVEPMSGTVNPVPDAVTGLLEVAPRGMTHNEMSGAAVWCGNGTLLTAVIVRDPHGAASGRLMAVPAEEFINDQGFREEITAAGGSVVCNPVGLAGLFATPGACESPAMLLSADAAVVPFRGRSRHELLDELVDWCTDGQPFAARLVIGTGGQGKTRLGEELIRRVSTAGWVAGRVVDRAPDDAAAALARLDRPVLLVVDNVVASLDELGPLTTAARASTRPVRLLLLVRAPDDGVAFVAAHRLSSITTARARWLASVDDEPADLLDAWREAATALAARLGRIPGFQHIDWPAAADRATPAPARRFATTLALHVDALAAVLQAGRPVAAPAAASSADVLLLHEQSYWRRVAHADGLDVLDDATLRRCVAVATLWTAPDRVRADALARAIPGVRDLTEAGAAGVVDWLADLYPAAGRCWAPMAPDHLAEHLVATELTDHFTLATTTAAVAGPDQWHHALTLLSRAAIDHSDLDPLITDLVTAWPDAATTLAAQVASQTERSDPLITALTVIADQLPDENLDLLGTIGAAMHHNVTAHREFTIRFAQRLVTLYRAQALSRPDEYEPVLATALNNLSRRLSMWRHAQEALAASEEATAIYRRLTAARPDAFEPDLAASLREFAGCLSPLRRREEAIAAIGEAVAIHRRLAASRPDAFEPELARSLWRLSVQLGPGDDGLAALEEVITLDRRLAAARPDAFEPELAASLTNLQVYLSVHPPRREEARAAIEEATAIYRRLDAGQPGAGGSLLARSLEGLSRYLDSPEDALAAIEEATAIRRRLVANHDPFDPALAESLIDLAGRLVAVGRPEDALAAIEEAIAIRRHLAAGHHAFEPDLAAALSALSRHLARSGRHEDALAAIEEATTVYRRAAAAQLGATRRIGGQPDGLDPALGMTLANLSLRLARLDRREEALAAVEEATSVYRRVAAAMAVRSGRRGAYDPDLAMTLANLSLRLADLGRHQDSLVAGEEATTMFRHLFATRRGAFELELAASLNNLSLCRAELHREDALATIEEATAIYRRQAASASAVLAPDWATSLWAMGWVHDRLDRPTEAAAAAVRESVTMFEHLPATSPGPISRHLSAAAETLARLLDGLGRVEDAATLRAQYGPDPHDSPPRPAIELGAPSRPTHVAIHAP